MIYIDSYIRQFSFLFPALEKQSPWSITGNMASILLEKIKTLGADYKIFNDVAIHKTVAIDSNAILKGPAIISAGCFIGAHSYLRGGVFLDEKVSVGPACEVKTSVIFTNSALGHFNFVGDSLVGAFVNLEAGSVVANHYNERVDKLITVVADGKSYSTGVEKFGALIGDHCKIGANAVLSPGTILAPNTIVGRLELIEQKP
jgi:bifunctional N-acetylglucosamine-1-phosphate-uridyltransferase/glucosamine-1-phosphate-acetyltransferase GlmU-like protein